MNKNFSLIIEKIRIFQILILIGLLSISTILVSCDLDENPPFLDNSLYDNPQSSEAARDGIYAALTHYNAQEQRMFVENGYSGLFATRRGGNKLTSVWMNGVMKLNPDENVDNQNTWIGLYRLISRANAAIANSEVDLNSTDPSQIRINDVVGHAYLCRAFGYLSLTFSHGKGVSCFKPKETRFLSESKSIILTLKLSSMLTISEG